MHAGLEEKEPVSGLLSPERPFPGWVTTQGWLDWINAGTPEPTAVVLRRNMSTGRPTGGSEFVERLERQLDRILKRQKAGRKPSGTGDDLPMDDLFGDVT